MRRTPRARRASACTSGPVGLNGAPGNGPKPVRRMVSAMRLPVTLGKHSGRLTTNEPPKIGHGIGRGPPSGDGVFTPLAGSCSGDIRFGGQGRPIFCCAMRTSRAGLMLPCDPERETLGRSLAAMLMAKQIKRAGRIHPETILTEIGALAGFATQMSIRKAIIAPQKLEANNDILVEVMSKAGEKFYFSELMNWMLFENVSEPPYSVWAYVAAAVPEAPRALMPDLAEIVSNAARTVGTKRYGIPRLPPAHMPQKLPRAALDEHWRTVQHEFVGSKRSAAEWPYDLAWAAQWQMVTSRDQLDLPLAAAIVMEAAIPMSKVDPASVPGA